MIVPAAPVQALALLAAAAAATGAAYNMQIRRVALTPCRYRFSQLQHTRSNFSTVAAAAAVISFASISSVVLVIHNYNYKFHFSMAY